MRQIRLRDLLLLALLGTFVVHFAWIGFFASDDALYAEAGQRWLSEFPYVGDRHWPLRHTLVLPIALSFAVFGVNEAALILPSTLYTVALVLLVYCLLCPLIGSTRSLIVALSVLCVPLVADSSSYANVDVVEAVFVLASASLFWTATFKTDRIPLLLGAGLLAGFAVMTRETAAALIIFYAILYLLAWGMPRRLYWVMAGGFLLVFLGELLFYWVWVGDPLHRLAVSTRHIDGRATSALGGFDVAGNLSVNAILDPLLMLLVNQEFGVIFYLFAPAAIWALRRRAGDPRLGALLTLLTGLALTWIVQVSINVRFLHLVPRYQYVPAVCAAIVTLCWLTVELMSRYRRVAILLVATIFIAGLLCISVENRDFLHAERTLLRLALETGEVIHTDPRTALRSSFLLETHGVPNRASDAAAKAGAMFLYVPASVRREKVPLPQYDPEKYRPTSDFVLVAEYDGGRPWVGAMIESLGLNLAPVLGETIYRKLVHPNEPTFLYRVPPGRDAIDTERRP